jgi:hypothetical protein
MLRQPAEAPPPLAHLGGNDGVETLRRVWSDRSRPRRSLRAWAGRLSGRADRRLLEALAGATEAITAQCDLLVDRLAAQEAVTADVAASFGPEIVQLRAEVVHLQRDLAALRDAQS